METFVQLIDPASGQLLVSAVQITDAPAYQWRGLMLDAGRRFFPVPVVKNLLDTMAGAKLNVLHLHLTDTQAVRLVIDSVPGLSVDITFFSPQFVCSTQVGHCLQRSAVGSVVSQWFALERVLLNRT